MKKVLLGILFLVMAVFLPHSIRAEVNVSIGFSLPAPAYYGGPPEVIAMPYTNNVYVVPDHDFEMFFWNGWWWRPWEGRWYRSRYYNRGWGYYDNVPSFYYDVDPDWRDYYRDRHWSGHRWNYERIPHQRLQSNWQQWQSNQYWQRNKAYGVENYQPRPQRQIEELRSQRQEQYRQRPEVQRYQQQVQEQQRQPQSPRQQQIQEQPQQRQPQSPRNRQQIEEQQRQPQVQEQQRQTQQRQPRAREQQQQVQEPERQPQAEAQRQQQVREQKRQPQAVKHPKQQEPSPEEQELQNRDRQNRGESHRQ